MSTDTVTTRWIQAAASLLTALGIVFGVLKWAFQQQKHNVMESFGATSLDKRKMGYFTVQWWSLNQWFQRTTPQFKLPTISTIIKAGDNKWFTSSMFDWASNVNDDVSWRILYTAFFEQVAWKSLESEREYNLSKLRYHHPQSVRQALSMSYDSVRRLRKSGSKNPLSRFTDRHLLYGGSERYILRDCVRDLDTLVGWSDPWDDSRRPDPFLGDERHWEMDLQEVCIWEGRPSILVSPEQLLALTFVLGMPLRVSLNEKSATLSGEGIHGTKLKGERGEPNEPWHLRLVHWRRGQLSQDPSKGSGFATYNAICMACGCLPFGRSRDFTHVVHVTKKVLEGIQSSRQISGTQVAEGELTPGERMATANCLSRLPSATSKNFYRKCVKVHNTPGLILDTNGSIVSNWTKVVSRIAFGGLVPMAALNLIKAVRFTAEGYQPLSSDDLIKVLTMFKDLILEIQHERKDLRLFGLYIEEYARIKDTKPVLTSYSHPSQVNIRTAAAAFARYMTVLEYITAKVSNHEWKTQQEVVYEACCRELQQSYVDALHRLNSSNTGQSNGYHGRPTAPGQRRNVATQVHDILNADRPLSAEYCGKIARYMIILWTYYVSAVVWNDDDCAESQSFLGTADASRIYCPFGVSDNFKDFLTSSVLT